MVQEQYQELRVLCTARTPPGARCCQVAVARGDAFAPSPGSDLLHSPCGLCRDLPLPPALSKPPCSGHPLMF